MNLLFVVPSLKAGGLEKVATLLSNQWSRDATIHVTLLTLDSLPPFYEVSSAVRVIQAPPEVDRGAPWIKFLRKRRWLPQRVRQVSPDVILTFGERYNAFVILSLRHLGVPIFAGNRATPLTSLRGMRGRIHPRAYRHAEGVFLQTHRSQELLAPRYPGVRFHVVPNPVEVVSTSIDHANTAILNVGSFTGQKNQIDLIETFSTLADEFPQWTLKFAGDGPKRAAAERRARELGIADRIEFLGRTSNLKEVYEKASVFAFTSLTEGFPNALAEAMRSGLAAVAYDCVTGPAELIRHGRNGFLVDMLDREAYARDLRRLMGDTTLRATLGRQAAIDMAELDVPAISARYLDPIRSALQHSISQ